MVMTHCLSLLTFAIGDSALREIVRGQFNRHAVAGDDTNEVLAHLAGYMSYDLMAILELDAKLGPRQGLHNGSRELNHFLIFDHKYNER